MVEAAGRLLPPEEPEAGELLAEVFGREGIGVRTGARPQRVAHDGDSGFTVTLADGDELSAAELLVAAGRRTDLAGVGTGAVGHRRGPARGAGRRSHARRRRGSGPSAT